MTSTVFVNGVTLTDADWFNDTNGKVYDVNGNISQPILASTYATPDGATNNTSAFVTALAAVPTGGSLVLNATDTGSTYMGVISVRRSNITIIIPDGVSLKHPAGAPAAAVVEFGDTASGNSATAYENVNIVCEGWLDGNKTNVTAPADDLTAWGFIATKISKSYWRVKAKDCHNGGFGFVIDSNYNRFSALVDSCGNATHTGAGFDINSSKYCTGEFVSNACRDGGRVLDNCFGNNIRGSVFNASNQGFICNNQTTNESYGNNIAVNIETTVGNGVSIGPNFRNNTMTFNIKGGGDRGLSMPLQNITTKTFDGSSALIVVVATDIITVTTHGWTTGAKVMYSATTGTTIGGLTSGETYWVIRTDNDHLKLSSSAALAAAGTAIDLTSVGTGVTHTFTENLRAVGNTITVNSQRSTNVAVFIGGDSNIWHIASNQDGRGGAVGAVFAVDVNGNYNTINVNLQDTSTWKVRGIAVRAGATENTIASYVWTNTLDPYSDVGTRTKVNFGNGRGVDIASSATINIPALGDTFHITGVTGITAMSGVNTVGRIIFLYFENTLTVTDGSNLKLAGNFSATVDDMLTGFWDGTNFYEIARSNN